MATAQALIDRVRRKLIDTDDESYSDALLIDYLNEAITRFATSTHCNQAQVAFTCTNNKVALSALQTTLSASVASKVIFPARVTLTISAGNQILPKASFSETKDYLPVAITTPTRWSFFAETVFFDLDPSLSGSFTGYIDCSYIPTLIATVGSTVLVPDQWHPALEKYMIFCCREGDRDTGQATGAFQMFELFMKNASDFYSVGLEG